MEVINVIQDPIATSQSLINDAKLPVRYHFNWCGFPAAVGFLCYYGYLLHWQLRTGLPKDFQLALNQEQLLALRHVGSFLYFFLALLVPPFIFEQRNPEALVLLSTVLQVHYAGIQKPAQLMEGLVAVSVLGLCWVRRMPYWRCFLNAWTKDKSEMKRLISLARQQQ